MKLLLLTVALVSLVAGARADCEACIDGWCHSRKTLIEGFHVTDQLAIDQTNNVLYVQLNSNLNSAFFLDDLKIKLVQTMNTSGMTVDQETQDLYVGDYNNTFYKYKHGSDKAEVFKQSNYIKSVDLLFYKSKLYYTKLESKCLSALENDVAYEYYHTLCNYTIIDFVVTKNNNIYFATNDKVYVYLQITTFDLAPTELVANKTYVLSTDKFGDVYFGDAELNVIYKLNKSRQLVEYAAFKTGSVGKFVFDRENNIVFHDTVDGNVVTWNKGVTQCNIHLPNKLVIEEINCEDQSSTNQYDESVSEQIQ